MASTACRSEPCAVITTTRGAGARAASRRSSSIPSMRGMRRSVMTSWAGAASNRSSASMPSEASATSSPWVSRISRSV